MAGKKGNTKKQIVIWACTAAACVLLGLIGAVLYSILGPNSTYINLSSYLGLTAEDEWAFVVGTQGCENAIKKGDTVYLPVQEVEAKISSRCYYDEVMGCIYAVTPDGSYTADEISGNLITVSGKKYVSEKFVNDHFVCRIVKTPEKKLISIWSDFDTPVKYGVADDDLEMRVRDSIRGEIVSDIMKGEKLYCLEEKDDYTYCMTDSGLRGYIKTKNIVDIVTEKNRYNGSLTPSFATVSDIKKVCMGWHMVDSITYQMDALDTYIAVNQGMNVISPTWYSLADENGNLIDNSDRAYVDKAHAAGMKVWGLVDDFNADINNVVMLKNKTARENFINQLIASAEACGLDGINMDFEATSNGFGGLSAACGTHYVQLLRELTVEAHKKGLVVSVDVPAPYDFNGYFDRKELGKVVDYVIIMAYDEHYSGSEPGSVASYGFVRKALEKTLAEVPADRVVLGVPFYTRQWTLDANGNQLGTRVKAENELNEDMNRLNATITWLDNEKQNYAEFYNEFGLVKVWINDSTAMQWKIDMVKEFAVAGAAAWRLGVESPETWRVFSGVLK